MLLINFNRNNVKSNIDIGEKAGNIGLGLLRIAFGKTVTVEKISDDSDKAVFTKKVYSTSTRVVAVALFILALPITILLTAIGCVGTAFSKSHKQIFNSYIQSERAAQPRNPRSSGQGLRKRSDPVTPPNGSAHLRNGESPALEAGALQAPKHIFNQARSAAEVGNLSSIEIGLPRTLQMRKIPPLGLFDTVVCSPSGFQSAHGSGELFSNSEIVEKLDIVKRAEIGSNIYASYTKNGKTIIQQQSTRGCTAATTAMLIMDNEKKPDLFALQSRNLGDDEDQMRDIQNAGLKAVKNPANDLSKLRNLIIQNDSCIVTVSGRLGIHVIIVDEVSKDLSKIRLRDPYHGWEITVNSEAFLKEWHGGEAIQIGQKRRLQNRL